MLHPPPLFNKEYARIPDENESESPELTSKYWNQKGQKTLLSHLRRMRNNRIAKNIVFFLGDGMGISTITAARIYSGQLNGLKGENVSFPFEKFPYIGLSKTYCVDKQTADSACSATAYLGGVKGNYFTIGVNGKVKSFDCKAARNPKNQVKSLAFWAQKAGKATGLITTTPVTHASPAGVYGHTPYRRWESDTDILNDNKDPNECVDLATQLVKGDVGGKLKVILGGGRNKFLPNTTIDTEGNAGERSDGKDLIEEWKRSHPNGLVVSNRDELLNINETVDSVLGLFSSTYMPYNLESNRSAQPSISEMTLSALKTLSKEPNGYFLFVEGGKIDTAHHETKATFALDETNEFAKAIKTALSYVNLEDTLVVVTADHSHTMSVSGFADRGNDILGTSDTIVLDEPLKDVPITTLSYASGPNLSVDENGHRLDLKNVHIGKKY